MWKRHNSWSKFHASAARRFEKLDYEEAQKNALEAIYCARVSNRQQEAESLHLLCLIYLEQKDPAAIDSIRKLIALAANVYGTDSLEYATSLELLACNASPDEQQQQETISALSQAAEIYRRHGIHKFALELLERLIHRHMETGKNEEALKVQHKYMKTVKQAYGPRSHQLIQEVENYIEFLEELNKETEAAELQTLLDLKCLTCKPQKKNYPPELAERYEKLDAFEPTDSSPDHIECLNDAVNEFAVWAATEIKDLTASDDILKELKILVVEKNVQAAQLKLADKLIESDSESDKEAARTLYWQLRIANQEQRWCDECALGLADPNTRRYYGEVEANFVPVISGSMEFGSQFEDDDYDPEDMEFSRQLKEEAEEEQERLQEQAEQEEMEAREMMRVKLGLNFTPRLRS